MISSGTASSRLSALGLGEGPSITVRFAPENLTRAPFELGCSPSMPSSTPAFTNSSLYLPMSVSSFSLGMTPASVFLSALTIIMNHMVISPLGLGLRAGLSGRFGHVKLGCTDSRTRDSEIDSSNYLFWGLLNSWRCLGLPSG